MTQKELAERCGMSQNALVAIEKDRSQPPMGNHETATGSTWRAAVVHPALQHRGLRHPRRQVENGKASADAIEGLFVKGGFLVWNTKN